MTLHLHRAYPDDRDAATRENLWRVALEGVGVGTIVFNSTRPEPVWNWSISVQDPSPGIAKNGMADTREDAMRAFREAWDRYREWLGDERWQEWVEHMAMLGERSRMRKRQRAGEEPGGY